MSRISQERSGLRDRKLQAQRHSDIGDRKRYSDDVSFWKGCVKDWYPRWENETYFLPPLHFNRVPYNVEFVAGQSVIVQQTSPAGIIRSAGTDNYSQPASPVGVLDSDFREDAAQERVLDCLRQLSETYVPKQVMMVISRLQFGKYLNKPVYAAAVAASRIPRPIDLEQQYRRGDFDILIIHRQLGFFIGEIKSVGANFEQLNLSEHEQDAILLQKIDQSIHSLNRADAILRHIVSDLSDINVSKILILPNIKRSQLRRVIDETLFAQRLCRCLNVTDVTQAVELCLCSDSIPPKEQPLAFNEVMKELHAWWTRNVISVKSFMTPDNYIELLARFCGPATTVEVYCVTRPRLQIRTEGEGVSVTGEVMTTLVLFPDQVELLNSSRTHAFIGGLPGTGKTIVLVLQGISWLKQGHEVHVVSTWKKSLAASMLIKHQIMKTVSSTYPGICEKLHLQKYELKNDSIVIMEAALKITRTASPINLCVIADEAIFDFREHEKTFPHFCDELLKCDPKPSIWAAGSLHADTVSSLDLVTLKKPLRSPPVVIREVQNEIDKQNKEVVNREKCQYVPLSLSVTDGPKIRFIVHTVGLHSHIGIRPESCQACGREVARILKELHVGVKTLRESILSGTTPLDYHDVLVLCNSVSLDEKSGDDTGREADIGLVQGMRGCKVPVHVIRETDDEKVIQAAAIAEIKYVIVATINTIMGLERKVVFMTRGWTGFTKYAEAIGMARCSSQLIYITTSDK